jgi:hypothetical protein
MAKRQLLLLLEVVCSVLAIILFQAGSYAVGAESQNAAALTGQVASQEEGPMEGVLVSARRAGAAVTVTVVSDSQGRYHFPAARLVPGKYSLAVRAAGYDLAGRVTADVETGTAANVDLKLVKTQNLAAQLTNAEWLASMPGTQQQKTPLLSCVGCHSLERIARSPYNAAAFSQVILPRMATYANQSTVLHPQKRLTTRDTDVIGEERAQIQRRQAEYFSTINLSEGPAWGYELKTFPRPKGRATRVVITEYDLPRPTIEPHDVIVDADGMVWYSNFGE